MRPLQQERIFTRDFTLLFIISFTSYAGMQLFNSILSKYARSIGAPDNWLGLVVSAYALMVFMANLVSGQFIDRINQKALLVTAMMGQALAVLGYATISSNIYALLGLRLLHGFSSGLVMTVSMSMVSFALPKSKLGSGMGIYGLGQTLAMAVGPSIGITLVGTYGYQIMFLSAFTLVALATSMAFLVSTLPAAQQSRTRFSFGKLVLPSAIPATMISLFNCAAYGSLTAYLVMHADRQGVHNIGLFFTAYSITLLATRPLGGRISDHFRPVTIICPANILFVASMLICAIASELWMFMAAAVVMAVGLGGSQPAIQAAAIRNVAADQRGVASATFMMGTSVGFIIGPIVSGYLAAQLGYGTMFIIMALVGGLGLPVMALMSRLAKRRADDDNRSARKLHLQTTDSMEIDQ